MATHFCISFPCSICGYPKYGIPFNDENFSDFLKIVHNYIRMSEEIEKHKTQDNCKHKWKRIKYGKYKEYFECKTCNKQKW